MSQEKLAETLGITFQQVQKYERGDNRISASRIYEASRVLKVPIEYMFEGLESPHNGDANVSVAERTATQFLSTVDGIELSNWFTKIQSSRHRRKLLDLVRALADDS